MTEEWPAMSPRFLIVDDHPLMRGGVIGQLCAGGESPRFEQAGCLADALRILSSAPRFDIVLLDLNLPDTVGTSGIEALRARFPRTPVMVLSAAADRATIDRCLRAGACGYLPKSAAQERLATAVQAIAGGGLYLPREPEGTVPTGWSAHPAAPASSGLQALGLTERQIDVLRLLLLGVSNKVICRRLKLAEGTVKVHVSAVFRALGVRNRAQAIVAATRLGLQLE
jgi:DNA-binding NarL/FixJ family response regulator